ncbi:hypothetical protein [Amycolatopsis thermophila]|uniref:Uncharacterized protein n=1 Tax=Amycolatopsis thermophila TaxID=206084 RepID=A0ABU0F5R2_9PSEU|nr:hypothetical protein [Amycolatopsis thermophila]MDQ0382925.1 hypothetical protein [Amycolatopsis thermophila]
MPATGAAFGGLSRRARLNTLLSAGVVVAAAGAVAQVVLTVIVGENFAITC